MNVIDYVLWCRAAAEFDPMLSGNCALPDFLTQFVGLSTLCAEHITFKDFVVAHLRFPLFVVHLFVVHLHKHCKLLYSRLQAFLCALMIL